MKITVKTEDFRNAEKYCSSSKCPLAVAIKRQLDVYEVSVAVGGVSIKNKSFKPWENYDVDCDWCSGQKVYGGDFEGMSIDDMIDLAKSDPTIEFPELELELVEVDDQWFGFGMFVKPKPVRTFIPQKKVNNT